MTSIVRLGLVVILSLVPVIAFAQAPKRDYVSPYTVKFTYPASELLADLDGERGNTKLHSTTAFPEWYSEGTRKKYNVWGPLLKTMEYPKEFESKPVDWKRERVLAYALRFQGYTYQHHHIPDWNPPKDWPWKEVTHGANGPGIDCSNFTTYVYNVTWGIRMNSAIEKQAETKQVKVGERDWKFKEVPKPDSFSEFTTKLHPGDLLYIRNKENKVSHVVMWIGVSGSETTPLILDSTAMKIVDNKGVTIPDGVYPRPFTDKSWYYKSLSHVHRVFAE